MERLIIDYNLVCCKNRDDYVQTMRKRIRDGWQPYGEIQIVHGLNGDKIGYTHSIVKYAKQENSN